MVDRSELLPFCMRCFGVGAVADEKSNFCHQCGSEGTCVELKGSEVEYLRENIDFCLKDARRYTQEQCKKDTIEHINQVREIMMVAASELLQRATVHDQSKLESPELEIFTEFTPKLKNSTYGSIEYRDFLMKMHDALKHHYAKNSHHPEHYVNGIDGMDLFDLLEMICDWKAAVMRHADGDIQKSLEINRARFQISDQLFRILKNTVDRFAS
ncbi:DUF5662 family protein [Brevibacillus sp. NPDC003359]|uniref:DUF5662 family protein n=1 Tax=unclassified Brevibacillus TaxID=2684853 RepID=UPI00368D6992